MLSWRLPEISASSIERPCFLGVLTHENPVSRDAQLKVGKLAASIVGYYSFISHKLLLFFNLLDFEEITYYHTFAGGTLQILQRCIALKNVTRTIAMQIPMFITLTGTRDRARSHADFGPENAAGIC